METQAGESVKFAHMGTNDSQQMLSRVSQRAPSPFAALVITWGADGFQFDTNCPTALEAVGMLEFAKAMITDQEWPNEPQL